ncbi:MAG: esterase, partial [Pirellulales bacterium]|nr:esterase [Pirellulales bacterium]
LFLPPGDEGWRQTSAAKGAAMNAGRFDIGPEKVVRRGRVLWQGEWTGKITGPRSARLTSQFDPESGVRLVRDFQLHQTSSRLRCTQTILNESDQPVSLCYWSRTFAVGGGVAVVPRTPRGRFPNGYLMYETGSKVLFQPEDPNIQVTDRSVIISAAPRFPKLGFDSHAGWLAYLAPTDQMFVKRFKTYPSRSYNEFAGLTLSVWYPEKDRVELEPIGPAEDLKPGQSASFSEEWWLLPHEFPAQPRAVDFDAIEKKVKRNTLPALQDPEPPVSPEVLGDGRVTFRFTAADAEEVLVSLGGKKLALREGDRGLWQLTTKPLQPGIYDYSFLVDGVRVTDPRNRWVKKWKVCASMFEVPGDPPLLTQLQQVPHGTLHHHLYWSDAAQKERAAVVYTPPGYKFDRDKPYPLLVLCHGNGDDQTAWTEVGLAHRILDNLLAQGKTQPMVVVMPHGHPVPLQEHQWSQDYRQRNREMMVKDVVTGVLPFMQDNYHVSPDPAQRAITGLSMGGGQSIAVAMSHPEAFEWVGAFSAAAPQGDLKQDHPAFSLQASQHAKRQLFWIACGKKDFLLDRNRSFTGQLDELGIEHTYLETEGAHSWEVWRRYLPEFLELIFR